MMQWCMLYNITFILYPLSNRFLIQRVLNSIGIYFETYIHKKKSLSMHFCECHKYGVLLTHNLCDDNCYYRLLVTIKVNILLYLVYDNVLCIQMYISTLLNIVNNSYDVLKNTAFIILIFYIIISTSVLRYIFIMIQSIIYRYSYWIENLNNKMYYFNFFIL